VALEVKKVLHLIGSVTVINKLLLERVRSVHRQDVGIHLCNWNCLDPGGIWVDHARREGIH
jgi:hypothetical protein